MASLGLFKSIAGKLVPKANAVNEAGGAAYALSPKQALAQYAATGCFNTTYYASDETQLATVLELCDQVEPEFIARTALFCRERGHMKDMPALLCAVLSVRDPKLLGAVFDRVIDDGKMLRNFVQIMRSGAVGRKSLGTMPRRLVREWLARRKEETLFGASVGQNPSLADVVRMVHPKPETPQRQAFYGYLIGKQDAASADLPEVVRQYEAFKNGESREVPKVPFQMLTSLDLGSREWTGIARNAGWQMTRMNLATFARHGVFEAPGMAELIAARLRDPSEIARARVLPYQLMVAYTSAGGNIPTVVREALQDAMEVALRNVPRVDGKVFVLPDVSGSMSSPVTGHRKGSSSSVRCIDVASLFAAALLRTNPEAEVLPFAVDVERVQLNPRDSVMTNAGKLAAVGGGGTNCSAPLARLNRRNARGNLVVYISDNQSWMDPSQGQATAAMAEWACFRQRNPGARMVCIDIQPYATAQVPERQDVLNIGGFSDHVFELIAAFDKGEMNPDHWVGIIETSN